MNQKIILAVVTLVLSIHQLGQAQTKDYKFQSLYVYNFAKTIEWPVNAFSEVDFIIGIFNNTKVFNEFNESLANRQVGTKKIIIKHFQTVDELAPTQILFMPASNRNNIKSILQKLNQASCLLITEKDRLLKEGSIINLVITDEGKMKYELNDLAATKLGLKIPTSIKSLAIIK